LAQDWSLGSEQSERNWRRGGSYRIAQNIQKEKSCRHTEGKLRERQTDGKLRGRQTDGKLRERHT